MTQGQPHHHGNLRAALIAAGMQILAQGQVLTLRGAAAAAGVSHAAPAHHFAGLAGLQTAIATEAFERFTAAMLARPTNGMEARARLMAVCQGYLDFAATNTGLFHLMFAAPDVQRGDPGLCAASFASYAVLRAACAPFGGGRALELAVWSLVHGWAMLRLSGPDAPLPPSQEVPPPDFGAALDVLLANRRAPPLAEPAIIG